MRNLLVISVTVLVIVLGIMSCDETNDCITCSTQSAVLTMFVNVSSSNLSAFGMIYGLDGLVPDIDSVRIDGHLADIVVSSNQPFMNPYIQYNDTTDLVAGESALVEAFHPSGRCWAWVKLLDYDIEPICLSHASIYPWDTIAVETAVDLVWVSVPHAEWYWIYLDFFYDSSGVNQRWTEALVSTDTTHTVPASALSFNGQLNVEITAMTGPMPSDQTGNVLGGYIDGVVNSYSNHYLYIYIGEGIVSGSFDEPDSFEERLRSMFPFQ